MPNTAVYQIKAAPLARRQRRAPPAESHNLRVHEAREALAKVVTLGGRVRKYYLDPEAMWEESVEIIRVLTEIRNRIAGPQKIQNGALT